MRGKFVSVLLAFCVGFAGLARAQTLDQEMSGLAGRISKSLVALGYKHVAATDFTDLQGQPTELGRFLSEQLSVEIVSGGGVSMVDRANIKSILAEHKLTEQGLVNPANAKKLGEFAGVDAILIGNVTALDDGIVLMVKAIATSSADIVAAGRMKFAKTSEIQQLLNRGLSGNAAVANSPVAGTGDRGGMSYQALNAIASKDIGSLRVALKSVVPTRQMGSNGHTVMGIRCSFEFINRETQRPIVVALNAVPAPPGRTNWFGTGSGGPIPIGDVRMGDVLRTTLVDESGPVWSLSATGVTGMSIVSAGKRDSYSVFSATDIPSLLQRQDELGTNMTTPDANAPQQWPFAFVFGSTTQLAPGQSSVVTMNFVQDARDTVSGSAKVFQIVSEIVVGVVTTSAKTSYSLQNLMFDRVSMPGRR